MGSRGCPRRSSWARFRSSGAPAGVYHRGMHVPATLTRRARVAFAVLCLVTGVPGAPALAVPGVSPHVASYALSLHNSSLGGEVAALKGRLEMRLEASCDGWRVEQALGFRMLGSEGVGLEHLAYFTSFEDRDGNSFIFNSRTWGDRELVDTVAGSVRRNAKGVLKARYAEPEAHEEVLPGGSIFPTRHLQAVLEAARERRRMVLHTVFDGSTMESPYEISTVIGEGGRAGGDVPQPLAGLETWPLRLAYFSPGATQPGSEFEMSVRLYDNGVVGDMVYDYGDFAIQVTVDEVRMLSVPGCP